ncbi:MAG: DUF3604 domain-containing protein [Gammaproteobacteria bacterium]|nr:hypothetical protein [Gammaproteobacteria bacterium]MDP6096931.1 DUF3604 domain-containing protein [Gammaproteobacteria bacterium]
MSRLSPIVKLSVCLFLLTACSDNQPDQPSAVSSLSSADVPESITRTAEFNAERNAYFGDLHVHTMYSFDAFIFGTTSSPSDAYNFAKGGTIRHPAGFDMKLDVPLDFYGVSDHAFYLGVLREMANPNSAISKHEVAEGMATLGDAAERSRKFNQILRFLGSARSREINDPAIGKTAWDDIVATANRHNDPGNFTAFIAYEYTTTATDGGNLHRNVIFRDDVAPEMPFSRLDSRNPEDLWAWMDSNRAAGIESLAIPHNSNGSNGNMFMLTDWSGNPLDSAYADQRMRNEPLVEITQVKGTSDTHPALSPNDEWADFEIMPFQIASTRPSKPGGSYVREAYLNGISLQEEQGINPFKLGVIGSSDTHNATYAGDEDDYWSKVGLRDSDGVKRGAVPLPEPGADGERYADVYFNTWGASGLAGVWAEENTRESIYDSFRRKETFGTSGPRMKVRFFAGYDLPAIDDSELVGKAYTGGVAMGSDLIGAANQQPSFIAWVARDPNSAPLQRLQIIKGWIEDGRPQELVYDVACSDGGVVDANSYRCPDNGAQVNLSDCRISAGLGAAELRARWQDPDYDPSQNAFYYVRAMENPSCRWSTWDAVRAGVEPRADMAATIQERVWSSPIWITPIQ